MFPQNFFDTQELFNPFETQFDAPLITVSSVSVSAEAIRFLARKMYLAPWVYA